MPGPRSVVRKARPIAYLTVPADRTYRCVLWKANQTNGDGHRAVCGLLRRVAHAEESCCSAIYLPESRGQPWLVVGGTVVDGIRLTTFSSIRRK